MSEAAVTFAALELPLAWNVRGNSTQPSFVAEAERLLGIPLPLQPNTSASAGERALLWLGPASWLLLGATGLTTNDFETTRVALNAARGALFDVSSSYVGWSVSGDAAASVLNKSCPLDLHPSAFQPGCCAQSLLGHITALFYRPDDRPAFNVLVARSFGEDAWSGLCASAGITSAGIAAGLR